MAQTPQEIFERRYLGGMPRAEIISKQAIFTLSQLHAELAGKFAENRNAGVKIKTAMMQVEAVLQMLKPGDPKAIVVAANVKCRHRLADDAGTEGLKWRSDLWGLLSQRYSRPFIFRLDRSGGGVILCGQQAISVHRPHGNHRAFIICDRLP